MDTYGFGTQLTGRSENEVGLLKVFGHKAARPMRGVDPELGQGSRGPRVHRLALRRDHAGAADLDCERRQPWLEEQGSPKGSDRCCPRRPSGSETVPRRLDTDLG